MKHFNLVIMLLSFVATGNAQKIMGFTNANVIKQIAWEKQFDEQLSAKNQDAWMQFLSSNPHHVGSGKDKANGEYMAKLFGFRYFNWHSRSIWQCL